MGDEDIDFVLTLGCPLEGSKERIASICMEYAKPRDTAESLKREYGIGGSSVVYPDGTKGWMQHDAKGIQLYKGSNESTSLSWANVRDKITKLVTWNRYGVTLPNVFSPNEPVSA